MGLLISNLSKGNIQDNTTNTTVLSVKRSDSNTSNKIVLNLQKRDRSEILKERNSAYQYLSF